MDMAVRVDCCFIPRSHLRLAHLSAADCESLCYRQHQYSSVLRTGTLTVQYTATLLCGSCAAFTVQAHPIPSLYGGLYNNTEPGVTIMMAVHSICQYHFHRGKEVMNTGTVAGTVLHVYAGRGRGRGR